MEIEERACRFGQDSALPLKRMAWTTGAGYGASEGHDRKLDYGDLLNGVSGGGGPTNSPLWEKPLLLSLQLLGWLTVTSSAHERGYMGSQ